MKERLLSSQVLRYLPFLSLAQVSRFFSEEEDMASPQIFWARTATKLQSSFFFKMRVGLVENGEVGLENYP